MERAAYRTLPPAAFDALSLREIHLYLDAQGDRLHADHERFVTMYCAVHNTVAPHYKNFRPLTPQALLRQSAALTDGSPADAPSREDFDAWLRAIGIAPS